MGLNRLRLMLAGLVVVAGLTSVALAQSTPPQPKQAPEDEFLKGAYVTPMEGLTAPKALKMVKPKYTSDAMRMKLQGWVKVQAVVDANGAVDRARVLQSLHPELDAQALAAVKEWTFEPGKLKDKAVSVAVSLEVEFKLH